MAKPRYPAPLVNGGYSGDLLGYPRSRQPGPVIRGAAFGLRAPVLTTGLRDGEMALPADVGSVAWLRRSASFRDKIGITVIAGHVSDRRDRPGALWGLSRASPGQTVTIGSGATTRRYEVTDTATFARTSRLPRQYFRTAGRHRLVLISCTGRVVYDNGHFHYTRYQIVVAKRIGSHSRP